MGNRFEKSGRVIQIFISGIFFLFTVVHVNAGDDLQFTASVDRNVVDISERITLTLQAQGDVSSLPDPKLPDFSDFRIISGPNESSTFQFINGRISSTKSWTFILKPLRAGSLTIASAEITRKRKTVRTDPITIEVSAQNAPPQAGKPSAPIPQTGREPAELFVTVTADKTELYPNEQVVLTYTIYTRIVVAGYEISKLPSAPGFWTEEFDLSKQPVVEDFVLEGRHYRKAVFRKVALFPTRSGKIEVDPLEVTCQVQTQERKLRPRDPFDILFDSPFDRYRTEERIIQTQPLTLTVNSFPSQGKPENFSGATGDFSMKVSLDRSVVKANEALTMTVRFSGNGNVKLLAKPDFSIPPDFEGYEPKENMQINKTGRQITGVKTFEYVLIPRIPGVGKLPRINFSYFDPAGKQYKTLSDGGFEVRVEGSSDAVASAGQGYSREDVKLMAQDIRYLKSPGRLSPVGSVNRIPKSYWLGMILPVFLALVLWWGARLMGAPSLKARRRARKSYLQTKRQLNLMSKKITSGASRDGGISEAYGNVHRTITAYLGEKLGLPASGLKEEDLLGGLAKHKIEEEILQFFTRVFRECNAARFTPENTNPESLGRLIRDLSRAVDRVETQWGRFK